MLNMRTHRESPQVSRSENLRRRLEKAAHGLGVKIEGRLFPPTGLADTRREFGKKMFWGAGALVVGLTGAAAMMPDPAEAADRNPPTSTPRPNTGIPLATRTPEPIVDFRSELNRLLNLSPEVDIESVDGMLRVGISRDFLSSNNISDVEIPYAAMAKISDLIHNSLGVIARSFDADSTELKLGAVNPPIGTKLRLDVVLGRPSKGVIVPRRSPMIKQNYEQIRNLLKEQGIPFQAFTRLKNEESFAESFIAFEDNGCFHLIINGNDVAESMQGTAESKLAFLLAVSAAVLRRTAVENQSMDARILEEETGVTVTNGDDIYAALGCTVQNGACVKSSGGVIKITSIPSPTATPRPKR